MAARPLYGGAPGEGGVVMPGPARAGASQPVAPLVPGLSVAALPNVRFKDLVTEARVCWQLLLALALAVMI